MIKENTVFILGAGASNPYGYDVGADLSMKIFSQFETKYKEYLVRHDVGLKNRNLDDYINTKNKGDLREFLNEFRDSFSSTNTSIDLFLSRNNKFESFGKKGNGRAVNKPQARARSVRRFESWEFPVTIQRSGQ